MGYDGDGFRAPNHRARRQACYPQQVQPRQNPSLRLRAYKGRNVIERCFCRLKDFRRVATRYDKRKEQLEGIMERNYRPQARHPPQDRWSCILSLRLRLTPRTYSLYFSRWAGAGAGHRQLSVGQQCLQELTAARSILHRIIAQGDHIAGLHGRRCHAELAQRPRRSRFERPFQLFARGLIGDHSNTMVEQHVSR